MKTMVMTAELLEPVPRSIVLASLTNNLPSGVSLLDFELEEKETQIYRSNSGGSASGSQYQKKSETNKTQTPEKVIETNLQIKGIAPSDIQVASFIARLSTSILFNNVSLVESKEVEIEKVKYREFRLKAGIKPELTLTKEDIDGIRKKHEEAS